MGFCMTTKRGSAAEGCGDGFWLYVLNHVFTALSGGGLDSLKPLEDNKLKAAITMKVEVEKWRLWLPGISLGVLVLLCGSLAVLQYKWLGDVSIAQRERLRVDLKASL